MSGFKNTVVGGASNLIRKAIRSPNYVTGVSGWTINKDGTAEFNSANIRATITVGASGQPQVIITTISNEGLIEFPSGAANEHRAAEIIAATGGSPQFITLNIDGPVIGVTGHESKVFAEFNSANAIGTSEANGVFQFQENGGTLHNLAIFDESGFRIVAGTFIGAALGVVPAQGDVWNAVTLKNSFTNGEFGPAYKTLDGIGQIAFHGQLITPPTGTVTGINACQVASAYGATFGSGVYVRWPITSQTNPGRCGYAELHPDGNVQIFGGFTNSELVDITGVTFIA